jgi:hypothetical protein
MTLAQNLVLLPKPRQLFVQPGAFVLSGGARINLQGDNAVLLPLAARLQQTIWETQRLRWSLGAGDAPNDPQCRAVVSLDPKADIPGQGYRLQITPARIQLLASDAAGVFYGLATLRQMLRQCAGTLPACLVDDYPDFTVRGVMLDISRDKVPSLETVIGLVDMLAEWKINHLELYMEHTFAYRKHGEVWAQASPFTGEEIMRLDAACRERFIELVPNQNSFGHLQRWLELPRYRPLAECPDGFERPDDKRHSGPFSLCPTDPQCLALLDELYGELLPHFTSKKFNVGCDETIDLCKGRSQGECAGRGAGRVYLDFLLKVSELVRKHGRTMHFWGDIVHEHPELLAEVPRDTVVIEWGYEAGHKFDERCAALADADIPFYVCPGTSSWNSITGRTENCLANLRSAAVNGLKHGASGYLITDWGDNGHWQYQPISYPGFAAGAGLSWCTETNAEANLIAALDLHCFRDSARVMGKLACDLGNAYLQVGHPMRNASALFWLLRLPRTDNLFNTVTENNLQTAREYIQSVVAPLGRSHMDRNDAALVQSEFSTAARFLLHACNRAVAIRNNSIDAAKTREPLAAEMRQLLGGHRQLWLARNRIGGLDDSTRPLEERLREYEA